MPFLAAARRTFPRWAKIGSLPLVLAVAAMSLQGCTVGDDSSISHSKACQRAARELGNFVDASMTVDFDQDNVPDCLLVSYRKGQGYVFAWNDRLKTMADLGPQWHGYYWNYGTEPVGTPKNGRFQTLILAGKVTRWSFSSGTAAEFAGFSTYTGRT